jgi:hypothetical protein
MQLHWVIENAKTVRAVDGVGTLVIALKDASKRYHLTWCVQHILPCGVDVDRSDAAGEKPPSSTSAAANAPGHAPQDMYDERSAELMDVLAMLYFVVEVFRTDDTFGDELSEYD